MQSGSVCKLEAPWWCQRMTRGTRDPQRPSRGLNATKEGNENRQGPAWAPGAWEMIRGAGSPRERNVNEGRGNIRVPEQAAGVMESQQSTGKLGCKVWKYGLVAESQELELELMQGQIGAKEGGPRRLCSVCPCTKGKVQMLQIPAFDLDTKGRPAAYALRHEGIEPHVALELPLSVTGYRPDVAAIFRIQPSDDKWADLLLISRLDSSSRAPSRRLRLKAGPQQLGGVSPRESEAIITDGPRREVFGEQSVHSAEEEEDEEEAAADQKSPVLCPFRLLAPLLEAPKWHGWPLAGRLLAHQDTAHKEEPPLMEARREG
eukprot:superscaffoldBa00000654_g6341